MARRDVRDDTRHPLLSKGRPLAQCRLGSRRAGRPRYGSVQVEEAPVRCALTDFTMVSRATGAAWSLNPYAGCLHACSYCYVPDTIRAERVRWGQRVLVKTTLPTVLSRELHRREERTVYLSTATDPYQSVEEEHRITRACLEVLSRHDWPIEILTRSPLVLRDIDLLQRFTRVRVGLSVPTLDDRARAAVEPSAPPIQARMETLRRLADAGIPTYANLAPAYPLTGGVTPRSMARAFRDANVQWVNTSEWRYLDTVLPVLRARLPATAFRDLPDRVADPDRQRRLRAALERAFADEGVPLTAGFFNPPGGTPRVPRTASRGTPAAAAAAPAS